MEKRLKRALALNDACAPALWMLADVMAAGNQATAALDLAKKAMALEPGDPAPRLTLARVLWTPSRRGEARAYARSALTMARTDQQRRQVQELLDFFK